MAEYIERKAVLDHIDNMPSELTADGRCMIRRIRLTEYIQDSLPYIEVVPCKECKHYDLAPNGFNGMCNRQYATFYANDFCSYGERA